MPKYSFPQEHRTSVWRSGRRGRLVQATSKNEATSRELTLPRWAESAQRHPRSHQHLYWLELSLNSSASSTCEPHDFSLLLASQRAVPIPSRNEIFLIWKRLVSACSSSRHITHIKAASLRTSRSITEAQKCFYICVTVKFDWSRRFVKHCFREWEELVFIFTGLYFTLWG